MNVLLILQTITAFATAFLGVFVVVKKSSREASWYFGIFTIGTALWAFSLFMAISTIGQPTLWGRLAISFGSFMPAGFLFFLSSFPSRDRWFHLERIIIGLFALFFFSISLSPLVVERAWIVDNHITGTLGSWYLPFWFYYLGSLLLAFIKCGIKSFNTQGVKERLQVRYITVGFVLFFFPLLCTQFILPLFGNFTYNSIGPLFSLPLIGVIAYTIIRHQFLGIRVILQRGLIYALLLGLTIGLYLTSVLLIGTVFNGTQGASTLLGGGITTVIGIFTVPFLERYFRKITDPFFFKDTYNYADALQQLSKILQTGVRPSDIVMEASNLLAVLFRTNHVIFHLSESETECPEPSHEAVLCIPILFEERCVGVIELGKKRSGEEYSPQDRQLLKTFAYQAAVALEKAKLYKKVEEYSSRLEHLVEERTQEIKKLQEEQKQAMIDISHNLQTPLAVIRGELELLGEFSADEQKVRVVKKSLNRVSQFIRQLLRLAKFGSTAFQLEKKDVDLSALVYEQVEYFEVMAEERGITLRTSIAPHVRILGDKRLLQELLTNLVANSIKYRSKDVESHVEITLGETRNEVTLVVRDNGVGIAPEILPEIFVRYGPASQAGNREDSTGLGLAICKKIVDQHNALISVESELTKGTEVIIVFHK